MARIFKIGVFDNEEKFLSSLKRLEQDRIGIHDVFTPYPVHEIFHMLKRKSRIPLAAYFSGLIGAAATLAFLYYTSVISWPIKYGGKPFNSFPSFVVVTLVITIFIVTIFSLFLFSARAKMFPGRNNTVFDEQATDDKFIIVIEDKGSGVNDAVRIMEEDGAIEIRKKEFETVLE